MQHKEDSMPRWKRATPPPAHLSQGQWLLGMGATSADGTYLEQACTRETTASKMDAGWMLDGFFFFGRTEVLWYYCSIGRNLKPPKIVGGIDKNDLEKKVV
jgi:hypothetical protein